MVVYLAQKQHKGSFNAFIDRPIHKLGLIDWPISILTDIILGKNSELHTLQ